MKAVPFRYRRPHSLAEACALLAEDEDARPIAGGQTLVPMLAMRLARPACLVDIMHIPGLAGLRQTADGIEIGGTTTQAALETSAMIASEVPLLARVMPWVGHAPTRARGTIGGSLANADPAAEMALVAVTLGAEIIITGPDGQETLPAEAFFVAPMITALAPGGLVTAIRFAAHPAGRVGIGFAEISARRSDFALAAAAVRVQRDDDGAIIAIDAGLGGVGDVPLRIDLDALCGAPPHAGRIGELVFAALQDIDAAADLHASAAYRRRAGAALLCQAMNEACDA